MKKDNSTIFHGYDSESKMRQSNPSIADHLLSIADKMQVTTCNKGKKCTGSIDGKTFIYADGSTDEGMTITQCRAVIQGVTFRWTSNN